jgi:DNA-directed RNA polymerase subunit H (RpoH/RPB5)
MSISQQIEKSDEDIRKTVLINIVKMITERGILKYEDIDKNTNDLLSQQSDEFIYKIKPTNYPQIFIKLYSTKIASINKTSNIYDFLTKHSEHHKIVVTKDINDNNIKNIKATFSKTEIFVENTLMVNLLDNEFVSPYIILSQDTDLYKNFYSDHKCKKKMMPEIRSTDKMALYYNLKKNDIVKIIRPSESTGLSFLYRIVV